MEGKGRIIGLCLFFHISIGNNELPSQPAIADKVLATKGLMVTSPINLGYSNSPVRSHQSYL